jgi:alanine dehydrogenase
VAGRLVSIRYLSRADVQGLALSGRSMAAAIEDTLRAAAQGRAQNFPKTTKVLADGRLFQSIMAVGLEAPAPKMAATKVVGLSPANSARGLPHIGGLIVLNDGETGMPVAVMDATWITEARTAALTLVAALRYARADASRIGFVGCGAQARAHLHVLRQAFPITLVTAFSRSLASAEALAAEARALGLEARVAMEAKAAVAGQHIVVTSVPDAPGGLEPFLSAEWLSPGSFAALVDLGRSWKPDGFAGVEHRLVDDRAQAEASAAYRKLTPAGPYTADLLDLARDSRLGRRASEERAVFTFQGLALADLAVAALAYDTAASVGIGMLLSA